MVKSLAEISRISDDEIVRIWLAERGLVAVERDLMDGLCYPGNPHGMTYYPSADRYIRRPPRVSVA